MAEVRYILNGINSGRPKEDYDIELEIDWSTGGKSKLVNSQFEFFFEEYEFLKDYKDQGLGVFVGVPFKIDVGVNNIWKNVFDGYVDLSKGKWSNISVVAPIVALETVDWLEAQANSFSFRYLENINKISQSEMVRVPYVLNYKPDAATLVTLLVSAFVLGKEVYDSALKIQEGVSELIDATTPDVAIPTVVSPKVGALILMVINLIARILYTVFMLVLVVKLIQQIFEELVPKLRHYKAANLKMLFTKGCEHLGLTFQSSIFDNTPEAKWCMLPTKEAQGGYVNETGLPSSGSPFDLFGNFINEMKRLFNADYRINNGVFTFERWDKFEIQTGYLPPLTYNNQDSQLVENSFNSDQYFSSHVISYQTDQSDRNTLDDIQGLNHQVLIAPVNAPDNKYVINGTGVDIVHNLALGSRKEELNGVEKFLKELAVVADAITSIFGGGTNFVSQIKNRIGSLQLSQHIVNREKLLMIEGGKLAGNQRNKVGSKYLWDNYYYINSFVKINGKHNQWIKFEELPSIMVLDDFLELENNNLTTDPETGEAVKVTKVNYFPRQDRGVISHERNKRYSTNLKISYEKQ